MIPSRLEAEYPGATAEEAYQAAVSGLESVPFKYGWAEINVIRFYESETFKENRKDDAALDEFEERGWSWIATLKATG